MDALKNKIQSVLLVILLLSTNYCVMLKKNDPEQWKTSWDQLKSLLEIGKEIRIIDHYDRRFFNFPALNTKFGKQFKIKSVSAMTSFIPKEEAISMDRFHSMEDFNKLDTYDISIPILIYVEPKNLTGKYEVKDREIIRNIGRKTLSFPEDKNTCLVVSLIDPKIYYTDFFNELLKAETISQKQYELYTNFEKVEDCSLIENEFKNFECGIDQNAKAGLKSYLESEIPLPLLKCKF
ncbi:hypothetical protein [Leptospira alstonii]|uniref:Uncharacterized protein n=2 Tax=Leptospira alstonii TaxID=28452 RepID=M6CKL7_9LEPT|nr:hypothetical protein [Leptospira alstonii]EMJ92442.1 hypothetical protein LEP1GSC194_0718 [Leptospira alstonii serovar Sichuan str. 79601]EQA80781.1 hypothetical protein LEP1GSC193_0323 [Leptospira alstonii serovar Pingchang str. 80-412]